MSTDEARMTSAQLVERSAHVLTTAIRRRAAVEEAERAIATATGTASSPDGAVTATVDAWGTLTSLRVDGHDALAATVTAVVRQAAEQARSGVRSTMEGLLNEGMLREPPLGRPEPLGLTPVPPAPPQSAPPRAAPGGALHPVPVAPVHPPPAPRGQAAPPRVAPRPVASRPRSRPAPAEEPDDELRTIYGE
jgi:hypothetical protein